MEKLGPEVGSSPSETAPVNPQETRKKSIQRCMQSLDHACQCGDGECSVQDCKKMKRVVKHANKCKRKEKGDCPICKQLVSLVVFHSRQCQNAGCRVPFCEAIKLKLRQKRAEAKAAVCAEARG